VCLSFSGFRERNFLVCSASVGFVEDVFNFGGARGADYTIGW
jgi:hypothetical protein